MLGRGACNFGLLSPGFGEHGQHRGEAGGNEGSAQLFP